jgi:O-antigen/teichoic acid export membrane protein
VTERASRLQGAAIIVGAAVIAGALSFLLTFVVARTIGAEATAGFTAFWAATYFIVGSLGGIQQEISRAVRPTSEQNPDATPLRRFAVIWVLIVLAVAAGIGSLWIVPTFGSTGWGVLIPLAIGPAGYVVVTIVGGVLYGFHHWRPIAAMIVVDSLLRLLVVGTALFFTHDLTALAWAIAIPFGATIIVLWPWLRRGVVGRISVDVPMRRLTTNSLIAVAGSLATAAMMSGIALLIVATSDDIPVAELGAFVFALTVVRAPIMVGIMSLQSLLLVRFRDSPRPLRSAGIVLAAVMAGGALFTVAVVLVGDWVLTLLVGGDFAIGAARLAVIAGSSVLMGALFVTGPLALALGRHVLFAVGWAVAAIVSLGAIFLPLDFDTRVTIALLAGPAAGVLVHVIGWAVNPRVPRGDAQRASGPVESLSS